MLHAMGIDVFDTGEASKSSPSWVVLQTFSGEPTCQKTITLEKASTLFNIAALYTQIGAKKDRTQLYELDAAAECFLKAAGIFQHIIG